MYAAELQTLTILMRQFFYDGHFNVQLNEK